MTLNEHMKSYADMMKAKDEALKGKANQKLYKVSYNVGGWIESVTILASSKKDARILSGRSRITKVELVA